MTWNRLSRRGFLGAGAAGLGVVGVAAAGWAWFGPGEKTYSAMAGGAIPSMLTVKELVILGAFAEAVVAVGHGAPTAGEAQTARRIDRELSFHDGSQLLSDVKLSLALIEHLPAFDFIGLRFTALSAADKARFLGNCETSPWSIRREAFAGLKFLVLFFYYSDGRTWPSIGYAGPQVAEKFFEGGNRIANLPPVSRRTVSGPER